MKEAMEQRLAALEASKEQKLAELNVLSGHIAEATHWLSELEKTEPEKPEEAT